MFGGVFGLVNCLQQLARALDPCVCLALGKRRCLDVFSFFFFFGAIVLTLNSGGLSLEGIGASTLGAME